MEGRFLGRVFGAFFFVALAAVILVSRQDPVFAARQSEAKAARRNGADFEKKRMLLKEAEEKINGTIWSVRFMRISGVAKGESFRDALRFVDNKFVSREASKNGFAATSFTVSLKGENIVVWETMQRGPDSNLDFWKGELEDGKIRGVLSRHFGNNSVKDYSFVGTKKEAGPEPIPAKTAKPPIKKPKKKKFWFW